MSLPNNYYRWSNWHRFNCPECGEQLRYAIRAEDMRDMGDYGDIKVACPNCTFYGTEESVSEILISKNKHRYRH